MPVPTLEDLHRLQGEHVDSDASRKRKRKEGQMNVVVEIFLLYEDLQHDRLGPLAKEPSQWISSIRALNRNQQAGTKGTAGVVLVEVLRSRVPSSKRGSTAVLNNAISKEPRRFRREDLEARFLSPAAESTSTEPDDDEDQSPELDEALKDVLGTVWREEVLRQLA